MPGGAGRWRWRAAGARLLEERGFDVHAILAQALRWHRLRVAILDPRTGAPAVELAIAGRQPDGWYDLGDIQVE